jgi:hypothetical protein
MQSPERAHARDASSAGLLLGASVAAVMSIHGKFHAEMLAPPEHLRNEVIALNCQIAAYESGKDFAKADLLRDELRKITFGKVWEDTYSNVVTDVGANELLDKGLAGSAYTAAFYLGLISSTGYSGVPVAANTMASHATWTEDQQYSQGARPAAAWSAAAARSKAFSSAATFTLNATTTIKGSFLTTNSTKGGTTGILYSAGLFTGGDQPGVSGNTLTVSYASALT